MRIRKGFVLRDICGNKVISGEGLDKVNYSKLITLNETAAYLWESVQEKEFDKDTLVQLLLERYEVTEDVVRADVDKLLSTWMELDMIEE